MDVLKINNIFDWTSRDSNQSPLREKWLFKMEIPFLSHVFSLWRAAGQGRMFLCLSSKPGAAAAAEPFSGSIRQYVLYVLPCVSDKGLSNCEELF